MSKAAAARNKSSKKAGTRRDALPFVYLNLAMSADGKIASANRAVSSVSSPYDRRLMMLLRTKADAVMAGARTVDLGPVTLGPGAAKYRRIRIRRGLSEYNLRVIVSGAGSIDPKAKIFQDRHSPLIILTTARISKTRLKRLQSLATEVRICGERQIDFAEALSWLRQKWQVRRLLCEGGGEINAALFAAGLVNELYLTICPKIIGGREAPTIADGCGVEFLADAASFQLASRRRVGDEFYLIYKLARR